MSNTQSSTKLSDSQLVILSAAAQHNDGSLLPFPESLIAKGAALSKVIKTLCKRKLVEEKQTINGAPEWRRDEDGRPSVCSSPTAAFLASTTRRRKIPPRLRQACLASARQQPHDRAAKLRRHPLPAQSGEQSPGKANKIL